jgi:hypothetical protein
VLNDEKEVKVEMKIIMAIIVLCLAAGAFFYYQSVYNVKSPPYVVLKKDNNIEIRQYQPMLVATVNTKGQEREGIRQGFRLLADFIFGNNIAMTAPVSQQRSEKISMTAPVMQQASGDAQWDIQFVMPAEYTMETLPKPKNTQVRIAQVPEQKWVVIQFSGSTNIKNSGSYLKKLNEYIIQNKLVVIGQPVYAYYNPPWTLSFMRRNEIMYLLAS